MELPPPTCGVGDIDGPGLGLIPHGQRECIRVIHWLKLTGSAGKHPRFPATWTKESDPVPARRQHTGPCRTAGKPSSASFSVSLPVVLPAGNRAIRL